jgi:hypothetical protein
LELLIGLAANAEAPRRHNIATQSLGGDQRRSTPVLDKKQTYVLCGASAPSAFLFFCRG